jgi:sugar lactone lactonase YvrE
LNVLVNGLNFANGIAWAKGETEEDDCVYVAETGGFRVIRVFTKGEKRGGKQVVV